MALHAARNGLLHVVQAHGADLALNLRDDEGGLKPFENVFEDFIDGDAGPGATP